MAADKKHTASPASDTAPRSRWVVFLPLAAFALLGGLFFYALQAGDPSRLPSALIGKPVPAVAPEGIDGLVDAQRKSVPGFSRDDFSTAPVTIVNVWASWCVPCTREHPFLVALSRMPGVQVFGLNYKDDDVAARRFLGRYGNPYRRVGVDDSGRISVEWGLTGVPETFVLDRNGRIAFKFIGEITERSLRSTLLPQIAAVRAADAALTSGAPGS